MVAFCVVSVVDLGDAVADFCVVDADAVEEASVLTDAPLDNALVIFSVAPLLDVPFFLTVELATLLAGLLLIRVCFDFERVLLLIDGPNFPNTYNCYDCFVFFLKNDSFILPVRYPCKSTVTYK